MFLRTRKFSVILMEQMKTPSNLIFNKCAREIFWYVYLGDTEFNYAILEKKSIYWHISYPQHYHSFQF